MYEITILKTAHINCANNIILKDGDRNTATMIGCHCFLLQNGNEKYLVDTGIEDIDTANKTKSSIDDWARFEDEYTVTDNLKLLGISPEEIDKVFLTHSHYDHISGVIHFENAQVYMTETEYDFLCSESNRLQEHLADVKYFLLHNKPILVENTYTVGDIILRKQGGHTSGSMSIECDGNLFVGDGVFTHENIERKIPAGYTANREESDMLLKILLNYKGKIITSHDFAEVV